MYPVLFALACLVAAVYWIRFRRRERVVHQLEEEKQLLEQERELVIGFMHHMVEAIGGGAGRQELWERIVHASIQATGAVSAAVFELQEGRLLRGVAVEGLFPPHKHLPESSRMKLTTRAKYVEHVLKSETFAIGEGIVGSVAQTRRGELVADATRDPRINQHDDPILVVRSIIVCPVTFRDELLGVLAVVNPADGLPFNATDFSLVENLSEQAGLAIHNADTMSIQLEKNRMDVELELASNIQGLLLPHHFPDSPKLDMAATYLPARKVGGDLYDIFELGPGKVGVAVADVSGKGVPGSLMMAICQTHLRHFARRHDSPSLVLSAINFEMMQAGMRRDKFVTMIYAVVDTEAETLTFARAGHERPLLLQRVEATGKVEAIQPASEGMALGMVPPPVFDAAIADHTVPFRAGECLVLFTDGVTEVGNAEGTEFASTRLADTLRLLKNRTAAECNAGILEAIRRFSGRDAYDDDLTLVTVKRR